MSATLRCTWPMSTRGSIAMQRRLTLRALRADLFHPAGALCAQGTLVERPEDHGQSEKRLSELLEVAELVLKQLRGTSRRLQPFVEIVPPLRGERHEIRACVPRVRDPL